MIFSNQFSSFMPKNESRVKKEHFFFSIGVHSFVHGILCSFTFAHKINEMVFSDCILPFLCVFTCSMLIISFSDRFKFKIFQTFSKFTHFKCVIFNYFCCNSLWCGTVIIIIVIINAAALFLYII